MRKGEKMSKGARMKTADEIRAQIDYLQGLKTRSLNWEDQETLKYFRTILEVEISVLEWTLKQLSFFKGV